MWRDIKTITEQMMALENIFGQHSAILFTILGLVAFLCALSTIARWRIGHKVTARKAPPEAAGAWPLIGHFHLLRRPQPPHVTLGKMADKYGPVFTIRLGVHRYLVVSSSEMAKECFTVNDKAFATRPKTIAFEVLGYNFSMLGFSAYGPYWRHVRKIATSELLSTHRLDSTLKHVMESEVQAAMKDLWLQMKESGGPKRAVQSEMKKWFEDLTLNVVFRIVIGKRLSGMGSDVNKRIRKALMEFVQLNGTFVISDAMPYLRWLDLDGRVKAMKRTAKELDYFLTIWLQEHKRNTNCGPPESNHHRDFMDVLLSMVDRDFEGRDVDTVIKATCLSLTVAGTITTIATLIWALSSLLNNREVLNKAIHELDREIGKERMVLESDLRNLVYLQAIIKETLRLYPPVTLNAPHESVEDCVVGGYHVPAGTRLMTNLARIQRDPAAYDDPSEFRPERFLTTHKDIDFRGQHFDLIPFGAGRRMCPGLSFGLQLMQQTLANLLHRFDIVTTDGSPVDMVEEAMRTTIKASPLQVILTPRLSTQIYDEN